MTFNNNRMGFIDQFEATGSDGHVNIVGPLFLELFGCGMCNPPTAPHDGPLFLAIKDRKMEFNPLGADIAWDEFSRRCHL